MNKFFSRIGLALTATAASACVMAFTTSHAHAMDFENPIESGLTEVLLLETPEIEYETLVPLRFLDSDDRIAVARLDGGRYIPTPYAESQDWQFLNRRVDIDVQEMKASDYWKYIPEIPFQGAHDTDNKIDEVRLTAAGEGFNYVLIYGVGPDASWASFGKKALSETGLKISEDSLAWTDAKAKALLVDSHTGEVLGAVTSDQIDFNIGDLADQVGDLITDLMENGA